MEGQGLREGPGSASLFLTAAEADDLVLLGWRLLLTIPESIVRLVLRFVIMDGFATYRPKAYCGQLGSTNLATMARMVWPYGGKK